MLFVMFESFGELITLKHREERGYILYRVHLRLEKEAKQPTYSKKPPLFPVLLCKKRKKKKSHNHASHNAQKRV